MPVAAAPLKKKGRWWQRRRLSSAWMTQNVGAPPCHSIQPRALNTVLILGNHIGNNLSFFFFQAEDGIRVRNVTGVQTCALPICLRVDLGLRPDRPVRRPAGLR